MELNNHDHILLDKINAVNEYLSEVCDNDEVEYCEIAQSILIACFRNSTRNYEEFCKRVDIFGEDAKIIGSDDELPY